MIVEKEYKVVLDTKDVLLLKDVAELARRWFDANKKCVSDNVYVGEHDIHRTHAIRTFLQEVFDL